MTNKNDSLLFGLLAALPPEGADWPAPDRVKWFKVAVALFDYLYTSGEGHQHIEVSTTDAPLDKK